MTFLVRLSVGTDGRLTGIVEQVRTGAKQRFDDVDALSRAIWRLVNDDAPGEGGEKTNENVQHERQD